jgi:hypothetical protein
MPTQARNRQLSDSHWHGAGPPEEDDANGKRADVASFDPFGGFGVDEVFSMHLSSAQILWKHKMSGRQRYHGATAALLIWPTISSLGTAVGKSYLSYLQPIAPLAKL